MVRFRTRLQRAILVGCSLALTVGGLELGFRWFRWHRLTLPDLEEHPVYHHRLAPHHTYPQHSPDFQSVATTNNLGLRGPLDYAKKPLRIRRLLMLGDSFTFGVGVNDDQTFCALVQRALDQRGAGVEVINAGLGSYSPLLDFLSLRDLYLPLAPDGVILWFDFGDLQDDFFYERNLIVDRSGALLGCHPHYLHGRFDWMSALQERSALAKYFYNKFIRTYQKIKILGLSGYVRAKLRGERAKGAIANLKAVQHPEADVLPYDRLLMIRSREQLPEIRKHWGERSGRYILMIRDLLRANGIPFALAVYPYGIQVGPNQWAHGRTAFGFHAGLTYDDPFAFELLEAFAAANGIPFLNTRPAFFAARDRTLFYDWDGHFTPAGHQVIADYLLHDPAALAFFGATRLNPTSPPADRGG